MNKASLGDRMRYAFDSTLSRGPLALIGWLALASLILILVISLIVWALGIAPGVSFPELIWMSLMRTLDAGTMGGDSGSWPYLFSMLAVTFGGIFVISTFIGVLTAQIEDKIESLRKGRSTVIERGHTVILGWSSQVISIITELVIANANRSRPCIVVLANRDKVEMEDAIRGAVKSMGNTRIVCRTGDPMNTGDLEIAGLHAARSIIILAPEDEDPDAQVLKSMLAITNNPRRRSEPYHIVAEIHDPKNMEVARMVGRDECELVLVGGLISQIIAQTCRQSGLSVVYNELLDFGGDEIYFKEEPALVGKTFAEALLAYEDSAVIGLSGADGRVRLNPPMDTLIGRGDRIVAVSADDDTIRLSSGAQPRIEDGAILPPGATQERPERALVMGWNHRATSIINELDRYVPHGSVVTVVADVEDGAEQIARLCANLERQTVTFIRGDTTDRRTLDSLQVATYDHTIILCYSDSLPPQKADARTLITLLHLRDIAERDGRPFSIVSEMLDVRNRDLAEVTRADDFIVSEQLVSLLLTQISENKALNAVFVDLFDPDGSELYLKPAEDYVKLAQPVNFYTVVEAARRRGEVALGYRCRALSKDPEKSYGVFVNPMKSELVTLSEGDRIIVLAEN